jgi:hypothetical protein
VKEHLPKESETIAAKRAIRLAEKIQEAKKHLDIQSAWWAGLPFEILGLVFVFLINLYLVFPFFGTPAPNIPFSGPIIPLLARLIELTGTPLIYAIQIVNLAFFLLFPLSFYLLIKKLTGRKIAAFLSVLLVSLPIYPFTGTRINALFIGTDGPHIASFAVLPLALHGLLCFIREGGGKHLFIASLTAALIALISPFGFMTFMIFAGLTVFSEMLLGRGRLKFFRFLAILLFAGGLSSFWYNPAFFFWMVMGPMGEEIRLTITRLIPISFFAIPILASFGFLLFDRKPNLQPVFLASFYSIAFALTALAVKGGFFPSNPSRYAPELGISLAFLISIALIKLADFLRFTSVTKVSPLFDVHKGTLVNSLMGIVFLVLVLFILISRDSLISLGENDNVLGLWTGVAKGDLWVARENFMGIWGILGITITLISFLILGYFVRPSLRVSIRKEKNAKV